MSKINLNEEYNNFMKEFIISPSNKSHKERIVFVANENHANVLKNIYNYDSCNRFTRL